MSSSPYYTYESPYKATPTSSRADALVRWARLKKYRIEVTYGVYVFTPVEKALFWSLFVVLFTVISFAALLYAERSAARLLRVLANLASRHLLRAGVAPAPPGSPISGLASHAEMGGAANSQVA